MTAYIATAAGIIFLTTIISFIIPDGKLNKIINFVMRIACICVLIVPINNLFNFTAEDSSVINYEYICSVYSQSQSKALENLLYENFGVECMCTVFVEQEDGEIKESKVEVVTSFVDDEINKKIYAYLSELGYIDINVNEKTY
jgi:hypothetical protein